MLARKGLTDERRAGGGDSGWSVKAMCPPEEVVAEVYSGQMVTKMPKTGDTELLHFRAGEGLED